MENAHQRVHHDHSVQRQRIMCGRAERIERATAENAREQRHDCKGWCRGEAQPIGYANSGMRKSGSGFSLKSRS
jgi:hypothetical protein